MRRARTYQNPSVSECCQHIHTIYIYFRVFKLGMHAGACAYNQDASYRCTVSVRFWCIESNHARDSPDHVSVRELPFSSVPLYMTHTHTYHLYLHISCLCQKFCRQVRGSGLHCRNQTLLRHCTWKTAQSRRPVHARQMGQHLTNSESGKKYCKVCKL